ncbi:hypothetical protein SVIO_101020 [Streptomyces violaceusniger]|uniref:Uncharacterized protein n=1 Tax=Streptomyces violaceusniger TaxID=68280 RepID=A0A4D4LNK5_STRVO|nr:hypothetical protein SVIO_101020 [Streptomyces violaceusniger]
MLFAVPALYGVWRTVRTGEIRDAIERLGTWHMAQTRQEPTRNTTRPPRALPPPALCGFLLLLAIVFTASYAVGAYMGPVAPGMHGPGVVGDDPEGGRHGDEPGMEGMDMGHGGGH